MPLILPGGAVDALRLTHHPVLARVTITPLPVSHGRRYRIVAAHEETVLLETLLYQLGSGAWPGLSPYQRLACRRAMKNPRDTP